ncbi:hypothetical protein QTP86_011335 [Hemibagrus guttatus]|nr:hypothetical protein QTP86_011335 [Hemibagrus guttatus]
MEKYRDGQRELHCVFVDLEKAYDRVPREELWYCMRKSGVAEKYVRVVQDMYERSRTVVRCAVGQTEEFNVEVGLHQGSALSPFLFAIVMDQLSEEVRQESPWTMMFADDIVICSESREQVEENLERWRFALERRGMKVSRSKTEYMCVNEREGSGTVRLQGEEVKKVQEFKYLGSTVQSNGECGKEKISARIKGKVYRTVVRPAMLYGLETVSLRKRQESELEVAELKMLRFMLAEILRRNQGCDLKRQSWEKQAPLPRSNQSLMNKLDDLRLKLWEHGCCFMGGDLTSHIHTQGSSIELLAQDRSPSCSGVPTGDASGRVPINCDLSSRVMKQSTERIRSLRIRSHRIHSLRIRSLQDPLAQDPLAQDPLTTGSDHSGSDHYRIRSLQDPLTQDLLTQESLTTGSDHSRIRSLPDPITPGSAHSGSAHTGLMLKPDLHYFGRWDNAEWVEL